MTAILTTEDHIYWSRDEFLDVLDRELGLGIPVTADDGDLLSDLGMDSLSLAELADWANSRGVQIEDELLGEIRTVGDLWAWIGSRTGELIRGEVPEVVQLIPVGPRHEDLLVSWLLAPENLTSFRLRGATPTPERIRQLVWGGVLAQFIATNPSGVPVGWVAAIEADLRNRHVHLTAVADPEWRGSGRVVNAMFALVDHVFAQFDLRKVYAEVLASNYESFASGLGTRFSIEGRLSDHEYIDGGYEDVLVLATTRERWGTVRPER